MHLPAYVGALRCKSYATLRRTPPLNRYPNSSHKCTPSWASSSSPSSSICSLNLRASSSSPSRPPEGRVLGSLWVVRDAPPTSSTLGYPFDSTFSGPGSSSPHLKPLPSTSCFNNETRSSILRMTSRFSQIASAQSESPSSAKSCNCWFEDTRCTIELRISVALRCRFARGSTLMASAKRWGGMGRAVEDIGEALQTNLKHANACVSPSDVVPATKGCKKSLSKLGRIWT